MGVDLDNLDDRVRNIACGRSVVDDHIDDAGLGRRGGSVERDLLQCRLIVVSRCGARERNYTSPRTRNDDAAGGLAIERQTIERLRVGQRNRRRGKCWTVVVDDRDIGVDDADG
jgi:hypothetical protein